MNLPEITRHSVTLCGPTSHQLICSDNTRGLPDKCVDLVICSPFYEDARTYGFKERFPSGEAWVSWAVQEFLDCCRVSRGLVVWVCEGRTRDFDYSGVPMLLFADLKRHGIIMRKPPIYARVGIPGSGGPDYFRNDYEFCIVGTEHEGKLLFSDNTACGRPPKYGVGGAMSNRTKDGERKNARNKTARGYTLPKIANPGNVIPIPAGREAECEAYEQGLVIRGNAGGGHMGHELAHENEAPYPEWLVERFVRSFVPVGGTVLDRFLGSGTTSAVAKKWGRNSIGIEMRQSQIDIAERRLDSIVDSCNIAVPETTP